MLVLIADRVDDRPALAKGRWPQQRALDDAGESVMLGWIARATSVSPNSLIVGPGDDRRATLILSGWAWRGRISRDGRRSIVTLLLPGDCAGSPFVSTMHPANSIWSLTKCLVARVAPNELATVLERSPRMASSLWSAAVRQDLIIEEGLTQASQPALAKLAHLLCSLAWRQTGAVAGAVSCELPITQADLADILGISAVHVNRTLQVLRGRKLIELERGRLATPDFAALSRVGEFDPGYLDPRPSAWAA